MKLLVQLNRYRNYNASCSSFDEVYQREKVSHFLEQRMQKAGLDLTMLLSLPLNVISDYHLMLERLLQTTPAENPGRSNLDQAYLLMKKVSLVEVSQFVADHQHFFLDIKVPSYLPRKG